MIKALALVLGLIPLTLNAHSMTGKGKERDIALSTTYYKRITIGNLSDEPTEYTIEVNNTPTPLFIRLQPQQFKNITVPLYISEPDKAETYRICSISKLKQGEQFNTSVCLSQQLYYPLAQLQELQ